MGKNILILEGSPRPNGNSDMLAEAFATGARAKGYEVSVIKVPGYKVNGCFACGMCWSMGTPCVQSDDMEKIFPEIEQADMIVFASPLYFFSWPTQLKCVIDRLYPYALEKCERGLAGKGMLVAFSGNSVENEIKGMQSPMNFENIWGICQEVIAYWWIKEMFKSSYLKS
ncbi:MAG: flavodoxin family protein [Butyricimonas faecihominis]